MVQFSRLRITGFKSFVEPTDIAIEPGLTGIVGPNGCGKSNLVEALRWVMGESSARQVRGAEMDDVIFAGAAGRPARNHAEVSILLDNGRRDAPPAFNDHSEIEIVRRIGRGQGSAYRVNGREVRARDVQVLFADASTGSNSAAMVGQGQVANLINAKPTQRRSILEEAAGITGLHARRHEAELRLRAAGTNLERLDDVMGALDEQLKTLKRQARQATRYRNISDHIRKAEAGVLYLKWRRAMALRLAAEEALAAAEARVTDRAEAAALAGIARTRSGEALPALRERAA
ncbi:MAG: AAA family ATPase, partial [Alphaproteobacteria bacterium]